MAFEYRQFDVENEDVSSTIQWMTSFGWKLKSNQRILNRSTRPVGAITYQNLTYIHSVHDIDDFTELLFERDLNLPLYADIKELEEEANYLIDYYSEKRPLPSPAPKSYDEWFESFKPAPFKKGKRIILIIILSAILLALFSILARITFGEYWNQLFSVIFVGSIIVSIISSGIISSVIRRANKNNTKSNYYKKMFSEYQEYCDNINEKNRRVELYDQAIVRIPEILREVSILLK